MSQDAPKKKEYTEQNIKLSLPFECEFIVNENGERFICVNDLKDLFEMDAKMFGPYQQDVRICAYLQMLQDSPN